MELAVFTDCLNLIERFVRKDSTSFDSFCNEWKAMSFQHIFSGQTSNTEICQTTTAIMHVAKRTACGYTTNGEPMAICDYRTHFLQRLGAIYLMYAVYFKQPTQQYIKVEVSLKTWRELRDFVEKGAQQAKQANFLFCKLTQSGAFRYTASDFYTGVDNLVDYDSIGRHNPQSTVKSEFSEIHKIQEALPGLVDKEKQYNEVKKQLKDAKSLPPLKICQNIDKVFKRIDQILNDTVAISKTAQHEMFSEARATKRKAFAGNYSTNDETDNVDEGDSEYDDDINEGQSKKSKSRYRTAARVLSEPLSKELLADLQNDEQEKVADIETSTEITSSENST